MRLIAVLLLVVLVLGSIMPAPVEARLYGMLSACDAWTRSGGTNAIAGMLCAICLTFEYEWSSPW